MKGKGIWHGHEGNLVGLLLSPHRDRLFSNASRFRVGINDQMTV
jgi:hypothetical protein